MSDYDSYSENTYSAPEADIHPPRLRGGNHTWSRVLAILNILWGVSMLSCILGIPLFIGAVKLFTAADSAEKFKRTGNIADAEQALKDYHAASQLTAINWLLLILLIGGVFVVAMAVGVGTELFKD